mmetsp:Transcript_68439/g.120893  ORF Transcript_68439/g.120893 Transcript_68439/m.120893 type:complete len:461 (-) Transcript_68439:46-1428(-)
MSRFMLVASWFFIYSAAEQARHCAADFAGAEEALEQFNEEGEEDLWEVSLLQTSLKLSQRLLAPSNASDPDSLTSKPRESLASVLLTTSLHHAARRTKDIIALPEACVLGVAFGVTLIFVVLLWAVMMEASHASKAMASFSHDSISEPVAHGFLKEGLAAAGESDSKLPAARYAHAPAICPALILPHGAAQFRIPMESITRLRTGQFPMQILGPSGRPLLHAWLPVCSMPPDVQQWGGLSKVGHQLQLTTTSTSRHPHASIGPLPLVEQTTSSSLLQNYASPQAKTRGKVPIEIFGPSSARYGTLTRSFDKWHVYYRAVDGPENLVLILHSSTGFPSFAAYTPDGHQVASAMQSSSSPESSTDMLTISVSQGADALLTLLSMLAVVLSSMEYVDTRPSASLTKEPDESTSVETVPATGRADQSNEIPGYPEHVSLGSRVSSMSTPGIPVYTRPGHTANSN